MNEQKNALISVYNKDGIVEFASGLIYLGWKIFSSGGTAKKLVESGIEVTDIATIVGGNAILGHRVVTISRELHAGLLANKLSESDMHELQDLALNCFDLVCVDCYPLKEEAKNPNSTLDSVIEKTDIGGPLMIRSGAKGNRITICDSRDRMVVLKWLQTDCPDEEDFINALAAKAEAYVADYVMTSAMYRGGGKYYGFVGEKICDLRYGENPWQKSYGLFKTFGGGDDPLSLCNFQVIAGQFGHVNWLDLDRMLQTMTHIIAGYHKNNLWKNMHQLNPGQSPYVAIGAKHGNPCGASISSTPERALMDMLDGNLTSIFGGAIMTNFVITQDLAEIIRNYNSEKTKRILDVVVAPGIDEEAKQLLRRKNDSCKMAINPALLDLDIDCLDKEPIFRKVRGGNLVQQNYDLILDLDADYISKYGITKMPYGQDLVNLVLAWAVCATSNSNTIVLVKNKMLIGAGVGQMDRLECCDLAVRRAQNAGHDILGSVACSDSFFPFSDGPAKLIDAGVEAIFTTSGSVKDQDTIDLCSERNVPLLMIPNTIGRMFYGH